MNIETILANPEGKTLEFKENSQGGKNIVKTLVAFSNTAGGTLVVGIQDKDKIICGVENPIVEIDRLSNLINDSITPKIVPNIEIITYRNKYLICVQVYPGSHKPYKIKGSAAEAGIYYRIGSSNREADAEMIEELKRSVSNKYYDEQPMLDLNPEEIDFMVASGFF